MHDRQNQVACMQATNFVNELPLRLSFTSSSEMSGSNCGSCLRRNDTPFGVSVVRLECGMNGFESVGSMAIPPMIAQKLCVIIHECRLERGWLSGSAYKSINVRSCRLGRARMCYRHILLRLDRVFNLLEYLLGRLTLAPCRQD